MKAREFADLLMKNPDAEVFWIGRQTEADHIAVNLGKIGGPLYCENALMIASKTWRDKNHPNRIPKSSDNGEI